MPACPCCGELLPAGTEPNELCSLCARAMDAGADPGQPRPFENVEQPHVALQINEEATVIQRPSFVTVIACLCFIASVLFFISTLSDIRDLFAPGTDRLNLDYEILIGLGGSILFFFCGGGFWKLSERARLLMVVLLGISLIAGGPPSDWWIRGLQLALVAYLMSPKVKAVFRAATEQDDPVIVDQWLVGWSRKV